MTNGTNGTNYQPIRYQYQPTYQQTQYQYQPTYQQQYQYQPQQYQQSQYQYQPKSSSSSSNSNTLIKVGLIGITAIALYLLTRKSEETTTQSPTTTQQQNTTISSTTFHPTTTVPPISLTKIMPLGDSITASFRSYRTRLYNTLLYPIYGSNIDFVGNQTTLSDYCNDPNHEAFPGKTVYNMTYGWSSGTGSCGDGTGTCNVGTWTNQYQPDIVLIHLGTNDVTQNLVGSNTYTWLNEMINRIIAKKSNAKIYLATIIPQRSDVSQSWKDRTILFNDKIRQVVTYQRTTLNRLNVKLVDINAEANLVDADFADSVHPNINGTNKMANVWYNHIYPL